jgi:predicted O-methyltransferase YrrM
VDIGELRDKINIDLDRQAISASTLLSKFRVIDEVSRRSSQYCDHRHAPFFYYLGKYVQPKNVLEIGLQLGFFSGCFLKSCCTVENFLTFQSKPDEFYSPRMAIKNIIDSYRKKIDVYVGNVSDDAFLQLLSSHSWDMVFLNEETTHDQHRLFLDLIWTHVNLGGLIVAQHLDSHQPAHDVFFDFCKVHQREPVLIRTRYGTGIIEK